MKKQRKLLSLVMALALVLTTFALPARADGNEPFSNRGDYATNGEFPESGVLLDWGFTNRTEYVTDNWWKYDDAGADPTKIGYPYLYNSYMSSMAVFPGARVNKSENTTVWNGAKGITTGAVSVSSYIYVPAGYKANGEKYTQFMSLWGDGKAEQGVLYSVVLNNDDEPYIGFLTNYHHNAVTKIEPTDGTFTKKIDCGKWYKVEAVINYDNDTLDYYIDDEYVCSHNEFKANKEFYEFYYLSYASTNTYADETESHTTTAHVYITGVHAERYITSMSAKSAGLGDNYIDIRFDLPLAQNSVTADTFNVCSANGAKYTVASAVVQDDSKTVRITLDGSVNEMQTYTVSLNNDVVSAKNIADMKKGSSVLALEEIVKVLIDNDFDGKNAFPADKDVMEFTDYYGEYMTLKSNNSGFENTSFVNSQKYLELNGDKYYKGYDRSYLNGIGDNKGRKALSIHRSSYGKYTADYWHEVVDGNTVSNRSYGVIVPFKNNMSAESGRLTIEFDAGKMNTSSNINRDAFTVGLHDANNEVMVYDKNNAWANSTSLFGVGDYYETATLIYKPQGQAGSYSYYINNAAPKYGDNCLWPEDCLTVQQNNNIVRHYKVDIDMNSKKYDIYLGNSKIGDALSLPATDKSPKYDAFVIGAAWASDFAQKDTAYFYLDNIKVINTVDVFGVENIENSDGTAFDGTAKPGTDLVVNFNKEIASASAVVKSSTGEETTAPAVSGKSVTIPVSNVSGEYTVVLNAEATDGAAIEGYSIYAAEKSVEWSLEFSATPAGAALTVNDGGYNGSYKVVLAAYSETADGQTRMLAAEVFDKNSNGIYAPQGGEFSGADIIKGFVFSNLSSIKPLTGSIEYR